MLLLPALKSVYLQVQKSIVKCQAFFTDNHTDYTQLRVHCMSLNNQVGVGSKTHTLCARHNPIEFRYV